MTTGPAGERAVPPRRPAAAAGPGTLKPRGAGAPSSDGMAVQRPIVASGISVRFIRLCRDFTWLIRASWLIGGSIALRINLIARINHASRENPCRPYWAGQETVTG